MPQNSRTYKVIISITCRADESIPTLYLGGFLTHGFFAYGFLFLVKELGFWTNPGHWVRVLDVTGSYMYFVL
jgi:hypothetical protein